MVTCHIQARQGNATNVFNLVVVCDSTTINTGVRVTVTNPTSAPIGLASGNLSSALTSAANAAKGRNRGLRTDIEAMNTSAGGTEYNSVLATLRRAVVPTSTPAPRAVRPQPTATQSDPRPQPAPRVESPPRERAPVVRSPTPAPETPRRRERTVTEVPTPRRQTVAPTFTPPTITTDWITQQLAGIPNERGDRTQAVTLLYNSRNHVRDFLNVPANSNAAIVSAFNSLYQIPIFQAYLNVAISDNPTFASRLQNLQMQLTESGLPNRADQNTLRSALLYIRYFSYCFAPTSTVFGGEALRREFVTDVNPDLASDLPGLHRASRFFYMSERARNHSVPESWGQRYIFNPPSLEQVLDPSDANGSIDADTLVVAALISRRWYAVHPPRGRGVEIGIVPAWSAPAPPQTDQTPQPVAVQVGQNVAPNRGPAPTRVINRIGIIGDSITQGGFGNNLSTIAGATVSVDSFGVSGQSSGPIRSRFAHDILEHSPPFNTVIIEAGVNDFGGASARDTINRTRDNVLAMIQEARSHNLNVIVIPILPWAGRARPRR